MKRQRKSLTKVVELQCAQWEESKLVINNFISMLYLNRNTCRSWGNMPCEGFVMPSESIIISTLCSLAHNVFVSPKHWKLLDFTLYSPCSSENNYKQQIKLWNFRCSTFLQITHKNYYFNPENFKTYIKKWHKNTRSPQK